MKKLPGRFVIFDTEYTAWRGSRERDWNGKEEYKEIVQIGAIMVEDLEEKDSFLEYIKPVKNPRLSEYFINLTGITQKEVDTMGGQFPGVLDKFFKWSKNLFMYSFSNDMIEIKENCELLKTPFLFDFGKSRDARLIFREAGIDDSQYHSGTIPKAFGLTPPPNAHNALNDARSILMALKAVYNKQ